MKGVSKMREDVDKFGRQMENYEALYGDLSGFEVIQFNWASGLI